MIDAWEFQECASCAAKPGSPTLCEACLHNRNAIFDLKREIDGCHVTITRQADLLTAVVNVIRGKPPSLTLWSHADAPELAARLAEITRLTWDYLEGTVSGPTTLEDLVGMRRQLVAKIKTHRADIKAHRDDAERHEREVKAREAAEGLDE